MRRAPEGLADFHQKNPLDLTHKAREKAKQLLIQSERAARERSPLERTRAGLQQRITEEQAKYASANPAGRAAHTKLKNKSGGEATTETSMMMIWEARTPAPMEEAARQPASSLGGEADCQTANTQRRLNPSYAAPPSLLSLRLLGHSSEEPLKGQAEDAGFQEEPAGLNLAGSNDDEEFRL